MSVAHVIADDVEALAVAAEPAADFRKGAAERDTWRRLPHAELEGLPASGLLAVTVPARFGGADVRADRLATSPSKAINSTALSPSCCRRWPPS